MSAPALLSLGRHGILGGAFGAGVGFPMRGLWVNTWTQVPPSSAKRSMPVSMPPAVETWAPKSTRGG